MGRASPPEASFMPNSRPQVCKLLPSGFSRQARPPVTFLMSKRVPWRGSRRHMGMLMSGQRAGKARPFVPNAACIRGTLIRTRAGKQPAVLRARPASSSHARMLAGGGPEVSLGTIGTIHRRPKHFQQPQQDTQKEPICAGGALICRSQ